MNASGPAPLSRRSALKIIGVTAASAGLGLTRARAGDSIPAPLGWELPPLGYAYAALEPHIDARTMEIHHSKHHQGYINNARKLLADHPDLMAQEPEALLKNPSDVPEGIRTGIRNNVGGHVNHSLFWKIIAPGGGGASEQLTGAIVAAFGSMDGFKEAFASAAAKRFGSGWAWLSAHPDGKLTVHSTANQDSPLADGLVPIIGLDVWEHAYYLHYQNKRADYVGAFWQVLNWSQAGVNYAAARRG